MFLVLLKPTNSNIANLKFNQPCFKTKREILLLREQYYLDNINPSLNVCKKADSPLGVKRNKMFSINLSKSRRGINIRSPTYTNGYNDVVNVLNNKPRVSSNLY